MLVSANAKIEPESYYVGWVGTIPRLRVVITKITHQETGVKR